MNVCTVLGFAWTNRGVEEGKNEGMRCAGQLYCGAITYGQPGHSYTLRGIPVPNVAAHLF